MSKKNKAQKATPAPSIAAQIALALCVIVVPLVWSRSVFSIYTLPKFVLLGLGSVFAWYGTLSSRREGGSAGQWLERSFVVAWAVILISTVGSSDLYSAFFGRYNDYAYGLIGMALYTLAFFWGVGMSKEERRRFGLWLVVGAGIVGIGAISQKLGIRPLLQFALPGGRAVSTIGSPVHLGAYLAMALALAIPFQGDSRRGLRILCLIAIAGGLFVSFSRGAWIAGMVGVIAVFSREIVSRVPGSKRTILALGAAIVIIGSAVFVSRIRSVGDSDTLRLEAWRASISMISERPIFGSGPDSFGNEFRKRKSVEFVRVGGAGLRHEHAHNDFLQMATTLGITGLLAYLGLLIAFGFEFWRRWQIATKEKHAEALRLLGGVTAIFITAKFNPMSSEILFLMALCAGAALSSLEFQKIESNGVGIFRAGMAGVLSLAVLCGGLWLYRADYFSQYARLSSGPTSLNYHRQSNRVNPCETHYARRYVNLLLDLARENQKNPIRFEYLDAARDAIARTVGCRSGVFEARYMAGFVALLEAQLGRPDRILVAQRELDAAIALDPTHAAVLKARAITARTANNPALAEELEVRIKGMARQ